MITVGDYIKELDDNMSKTEKHIFRCNEALKSKEFKEDVSYLSAVKDNLKKSINMKSRLHNEIVGMIDYQDKYGSERNVDSFGWQRFLPERLKGNGHWYDGRDTNDSLSNTGATQEDFEFW